MPVWWGTFAYSVIISIIGMFMYKSKKQSATLVPVDERKQYRSIGLFFALASFALLVFFVGNRSVIFDTQEYEHMYNIFYKDDLNQITAILNGTNDTKGPLFFIGLIIYKHITHGTCNDWLFSIAIFQALSIALFLYRYSINFVYSVFLFYMTSGFIWMVNGMRQFLAVTLVLFFVEWLFKKKTIPFIIIVIVASFIHSSALLWVPVYFIVHFELWSKKFIVAIIVFVIGLVLYSRSSLLEGTEYSYLTTDTSIGVNPMRFLVSAVPAVIVFIRRVEFDKKATKIDKIIFKLTIVCAACYLVGVFSNGVVARIAVFFEPFVLLFLPWVLKNVFDESMGKTITLVSFLGYFAFFLYEMYGVHKGIYNSDILNLHYWKV